MADHDDQSAARATTRRLMGDFGPDYFRQLDERRAFPEAFFEAAARAGLFGALIPEADGGSGAGPTVAAAVVEEINRAGGDAAAINAQMAICGTLVRAGSDAQRARYLPAIARGELRCLAVAATEPDSGADMAALESHARRDGHGWVLSAHKVFISMIEHTDIFLLLVRTEQGPTLFVVERERAESRLEVRPLPLVVNRMTTTLFIDELPVSDDARVGAVGGGLEALMGGFAIRRVLAASEAIGNARFLLDRSIEHAKTRRVFDRAIGENQGVQYPLAQAYAKVEAADLMRADALALVESGDPGAGPRSALAKVLASEAAWETARAALTAFGGWGLASELHIERKLRESSVFVFNNMLLSMIAQRMLGLPKAF